MPFGDYYKGRRVLVTGHTGFKGSWLAEWLLELGADVTGIALPPPTEPSLFKALGLESKLHHHIGNIRDASAVKKVVEKAKPDFVFHLAAQSLVRDSYAEPVETYATNVMGTINLLEALRGVSAPCAAVFVTSDKCYENHESGRSYREEDPLGGSDPYSSSKAAAEIAIASWRRSFFRNSNAGIASGRAGNVIGGGDWAANRIVPDAIRALQANEPIPVRNPAAQRPWQHVLEPLSGYLHLGATIYRSLDSDASRNNDLLGAFNFGPPDGSNQSVETLVERILSEWPGSWNDHSDPNAVHEAKLLHLSIEKASRMLGWNPVWEFGETADRTVSWYRQASDGVDAVELTASDIVDYEAKARSRGLAWSR